MSEIETFAHQNREEWLEARRHGIGGSDAPIITGDSPWGSALQLYCDKLGIGDAVEETEPMWWGKALEPTIARRYAEETGRVLVDPGDFVIWRNPTYPWAHATLDRWGMSGKFLLEIKSVDRSHARDWDEGIPRYVWVQVQHQLAVSGYELGSVAALIGGNHMVWMDVPRDQEFIDRLMETEQDWWLTHVVGADPPPPDGTERTKQLLGRLYPKDVGTSVPLPGNAMEWDVDLQAVKAEIKALEAKELSYENLIRAELKEATIGVLPNGVSYSWKQQTLPERVLKASTFRVLRRHASR